MANNIRFSHFVYDTSNSFILGCPSVLWMTGSCRCVKRQAITWSWKFESLEVEMSLGHESFSAFRLCSNHWNSRSFNRPPGAPASARSSCDFHTWVYLTQEFFDFQNLVIGQCQRGSQSSLALFEEGCFLKGSIQNSGKSVVIGL